MSCGVGRRFGSDAVLQWLWFRLAATAPVCPLAWEIPCAMGASLENKNRLKNKKINYWGSRWDSVIMNPTSINEDVGLIPGPSHWVKDLALP